MSRRRYYSACPVPSSRILDCSKSSLEACENSSVCSRAADSPDLHVPTRSWRGLGFILNPTSSCAQRDDPEPSQPSILVVSALKDLDVRIIDHLTIQHGKAGPLPRSYGVDAKPLPLSTKPGAVRAGECIVAHSSLLLHS